MEGKITSRAEVRRQAMLEAATALFLEKGFEQTTLSDIVKRSGGSRTTLYEQFGSKEGLLRAMIEESTARVWDTLRWKNGPPPLTEEELVAYGCTFAEAISTPDAISVYRIVFAESLRMPDIAQLFLDRGPGLMRQQLTEWFRGAQADGKIAAGAVDDLVVAFTGLILGDVQMSCGMAVDPPDAEAMQRYIRTAVRIFLNGFG